MAEEKEGDEKEESLKKAKEEEQSDEESQKEVPIEEDQIDEEPQEKVPGEEDHTDEEPLEPEEVPEDVEGYDAGELKEEIEDVELPEEEKPPEDLLSEIREERRQLEEDRAKFLKEMEQKERKMKAKKAKRKEKEMEKREEKEEKEKETLAKKGAIKSFAKERRKRKELERIRAYLFGGEYALMLILVMAFLYSEGTSFDPVYLPLENSIYLIVAFILIMKAERFFFRFLNMKYSGTLQRKTIGVEHFKGLEIPIMIFWAFLVVFFLLPPISDFITELFVIFRFNDVVPFSDNVAFNLGMLFLTSLILSIAWFTFLIVYKEYVLAPELKKVEEPFEIEDIFLITNSGLLIKHITRELKPGVDDDILTGMLTAVKDFVKDSFRTHEEGELDELQYGRLRIVLEYGRDVYIAAVVRGQEPKELRPEMKRTLKQIQRKFGRILESWDGNLAKVRDVEYLIKPLISVK